MLHNGNLALDDVIEIARIMRDRSCARELKGTVKEILGTCLSVGCTVDHQEPREVQEAVSALLARASPISLAVFSLLAVFLQALGLTITNGSSDASACVARIEGA